MRIFCALCGLFLAVVVVNCSPIVKREAEETLKDLDPLNEVYVFEIEDDAADGGKSENREKRKIGIKLGLTNGVINFVFDKLDSFLVAKTKALEILDESNHAKNAIFGIDPKQSSTSLFISNLVSQKIKAATAGIGPAINSATALISGKANGLTNSLTHSIASKIAPLSSASGGVSGGGTGGSAGGSAGNGGASIGSAFSGSAGNGGASIGSALIGNLLSAGINSLSTLSQSSGNGTSQNGGGAGGNAGINLGGYANIGGYEYSPPQADY